VAGLARRGAPLPNVAARLYNRFPTPSGDPLHLANYSPPAGARHDAVPVMMQLQPTANITGGSMNELPRSKRGQLSGAIEAKN